MHSLNISDHVCSIVPLHLDIAVGFSFLNHCFPICCYFNLIHDCVYFTHSFIHITLKCHISFQLSKLCKSLDMSWEESPYEVILFRWIQFLQEETLDILNISSPLVLTTKMKFALNDPSFDSRAVQDVASSAALLDSILAFDQQERERVFRTSHFCCGVCFCEKTGSDCIAFPKCEHVFCTECISEYFKVQIESGSVKALNCPETKCESQALPSQVKNLVSPDLFAKYDKYLLQSSLDEMSDIVYCPRPSCQSPVILEQDTTMGVCQVCRFAFCSLCKFTFHGVSPCVFRPNEVRRLKAEYENATEAEKLFLERRYGKNRIRRMIDDLISEEWLVDNSKTCPRCQAHIQKSEGCNKMHCSKCRTNFCWLCGKILDQQNPYLHFNMWNSSCFNKLFEGVEIDSD